MVGIKAEGYAAQQHDVVSSASIPNFSDTSCAASGAGSSQTFRIDKSYAGHGVDSTQVIQNAINWASAAGGGRVVLPAGTFTVDGHLVIKNNVELIGAGATTVIKAGPGFLNSQGPNGGYPVITTSGASNVTIANLTADQSGNVLNGNSNPHERLAAFLVDVRNSRNAIVSGVTTLNPFTYSIAVVDSSNFCVTHSSTQVATSGRYDQLDGIHILDSHTGQVIGNNVDQRIGTDGDDGLVAHSIGAPIYDVLYADNNVRGGDGGDGMQIAVGNYPVYNITIRNNNFYGSPFGIRTGYYSTGSNGTVSNIMITKNYIHDLVPGKAFPNGGNAVDIGDFGAKAPVTYVMAVQNMVCHAGTIIVVHGSNNLVAQNSTC